MKIKYIKLLQLLQIFLIKCLITDWVKQKIVHKYIKNILKNNLHTYYSIAESKGNCLSNALLLKWVALTAFVWFWMLLNVSWFMSEQCLLISLTIYAWLLWCAQLCMLLLLKKESEKTWNASVIDFKCIKNVSLSMMSCSNS